MRGAPEMGTTSRRGFLKALGATLSAVGAATNVTPLLSAAQVGPDLQTAGSSANSYAVPSYGRSRPRLAIEPYELEILVAEQLSEWTAEGRTFTAYDVTRRLRADHPLVAIDHAGVREIVHRRMWPALAARVYDRTQEEFATGWAW